MNGEKEQKRRFEGGRDGEQNRQTDNVGGTRMEHAITSSTHHVCHKHWHDGEHYIRNDDVIREQISPSRLAQGHRERGHQCSN